MMFWLAPVQWGSQAVLPCVPASAIILCTPARCQAVPIPVISAECRQCRPAGHTAPAVPSSGRRAVGNLCSNSSSPQQGGSTIREKLSGSMEVSREMTNYRSGSFCQIYWTRGELTTLQHLIQVRSLRCIGRSICGKQLMCTAWVT